jgi:hypothetical protein
MQKALYIIGGVILIIILIAIVTGGSENEDSRSNYMGEESISDETRESGSGNSRTNPARINETLTVKRDTIFDKVTYEIELLEIISGSEAWIMVKDANMFNDEPGAGKEYILAKFRIKVLETEGDEPYSVSSFQFEAVSKEGVVYSESAFAAGISPDISTDIYEGGEHVGYTVFLVEKEDSPLAAVHRNEKGVAWFDLRSE